MKFHQSCKVLYIFRQELIFHFHFLSFELHKIKYQECKNGKLKAGLQKAQHPN